MREQNNDVERRIAQSALAEKNTVTTSSSSSSSDSFEYTPWPGLRGEAKELKARLASATEEQTRINGQILDLALSLPNLTSDDTPSGDTPRVVGYINANAKTAQETRTIEGGASWPSHVEIGTRLDLLDFTAAAHTSGWGWYFLKDQGAMLEQALVQYALEVAMRRGWRMVTPPSIVYSHLAAGCGFRPRDQHGERQIYVLQQAAKGQVKAELSMAGTAEIPLAGMKANVHVHADELPLKVVGVSRCYRAEAGARGADTKGLYRVHEFTKVEMFAWTLPDQAGKAGQAEPSRASVVFDDMISIQSEILSSLGLPCRILEMPSMDLGASATRKRDIEVFFPCRRRRRHHHHHQHHHPSKDDESKDAHDHDDDHDLDHDEEGWGEVTSASICSDYQTRRLATRLCLPFSSSSSSSSSSEKNDGRRSSSFPHTVNGTAMAVPRVLAALLEHGWDESSSSIYVPEVLRPWMRGQERICKWER